MITSSRYTLHRRFLEKRGYTITMVPPLHVSHHGDRGAGGGVQTCTPPTQYTSLHAYFWVQTALDDRPRCWCHGQPTNLRSAHEANFILQSSEASIKIHQVDHMPGLTFTGDGNSRGNILGAKKNYLVAEVGNLWCDGGWVGLGGLQHGKWLN